MKNRKHKHPFPKDPSPLNIRPPHSSPGSPHNLRGVSPPVPEFSLAEILSDLLWAWAPGPPVLQGSPSSLSDGSGIAGEVECQVLRFAISQAKGKTGHLTPERQDLTPNPPYDWFTEGFDTKDLQDAKALLEELA